jgi:hypothetical protein
MILDADWRKMKTQRILAMVFLLSAASATFSQPSGTTNTAANRSWQSFWRQITVAVNKKDHAALKKMMPNDFFDGGGGLTPSEWLREVVFCRRSWRLGSPAPVS